MRETLELTVPELDCADEAQHIEGALGRLAGVTNVRTAVGARKAIVAFDPERVTPEAIRTGDRRQVAEAVAGRLGLDFQAEVLPEDKIRVIAELQRQGHVVAMVGDGINDAPALAQADVGIAMGAAGTDAAIDAAHVALMQDNWLGVPEAIAIGRRAFRTIKQNLWFTVAYNVVGMLLAATGWLPPVAAAAAQSLPDVAVMLNASRLLRRGSTEPTLFISRATEEISGR